MLNTVPLHNKSLLFVPFKNLTPISLEPSESNSEAHHTSANNLLEASCCCLVQRRIPHVLSLLFFLYHFTLVSKYVPVIHSFLTTVKRSGFKIAKTKLSPLMVSVGHDFVQNLTGCFWLMVSGVFAVRSCLELEWQVLKHLEAVQTYLYSCSLKASLSFPHWLVWSFLLHRVLYRVRLLKWQPRA